MSGTACSENALVRFCSFLISAKIFDYKGQFIFKAIRLSKLIKSNILVNIKLRKSTSDNSI